MHVCEHEEKKRNQETISYHLFVEKNKIKTKKKSGKKCLVSYFNFRYGV